VDNVVSHLDDAIEPIRFDALKLTTLVNLLRYISEVLEPRRHSGAYSTLSNIE
jgi:hypothetical protein